MRLAFLFLCFFFFAVPVQAVEQDRVYDRVMKSKTIRCGYSDWPPFIVTDPNTKRVSGIMKDIMDEIGKRAGLKIEWTASLGWGEIVEAANSNKIDLFCNTVWTDKVQLQNMSITRPLYYTPTFAYARADDKRFDNNYERINSPKTTIVGIDGDTSMVTMQDHFPKAKMLSLPNASGLAEQLESVKTGKGDVTLADASVMEDFEKKNPGAIKQVQGKPLFVMNEVLVTRAGEQQLMNVIDSVLVSLINEGFIEEAFKKYNVTNSYMPRPDFDRPAIQKKK